MKEYLTTIEEEADSLTGLIDNLLEASRLQSGTFSLDIHQDASIRSIARSVARKFQQQTDKHQIVVDFGERFPEVPADEKRITQVFNNLVSNAIKFSPQGRKVELILEKGPDDYLIHVRDEGPGLTQEDQKNLFRKFQKLSARPTGGETSTGLGLSIVKQLAHRINAEILVSSIPGKGATYNLRLPHSLSIKQSIA